MTTKSTLGKILRFTGIVLMGLTAGFTLLGGIGTTCAALAPSRYESMKALAPFQWLYILFVLTGIALGIWGIRTTIQLIKGAEKSHQTALVVLVSGSAVGIIHIIVSRMLRGKSMPVDAVVYTTILTLVVFLIFRIPAVYQVVDFRKGNTKTNRPAGGVLAIMLGVLILTIQITMGGTHTWGGVNYADAFNGLMTTAGLACFVTGAGLLISCFDCKLRQRMERAAADHV